MIEFIKIDVFVKDSITPPPFLGSTIRGAFGVALKKVVCINPSYKCENCFAVDNCLYYDFFEKKGVFHKFRFDFSLHQDSYDFSLYIFEDTTQRHPYILSALHMMLTELGLGVDRKKFEIDRIVCNSSEVYKDGEFDLKNITSKEFEIQSYHDSIKLSFKTPFRIKHNNRFLRNTPSIEIILRSIYNRYRELKGLDRAKLPFEPKAKEILANTQFKDFGRYSNRQKTKMQLGGVVGDIVYKEVDDMSYRFLKLGEIIGVGKQTVFGLGKIEVEEI